jgi:hypothetical protein
VGFNASHSMGLILFALVFGYLALAHDQLLFQSPFLLVVGLAMLGGLVVSARFIFSGCLSQASVFPWPAISPALRCRGLTMRPPRKQALCAYKLAREVAESLPIPIRVRRNI